MADLTGQLKLHQQINQILQNRQAILEKNNQTISAQARIAKELCKAMECKDLEKLEERLSSIKSGLEKAGDAAEQSFDTMEDSAKDAASALEKVEENAYAIGAATGAIKGFGVGMKRVGATLKAGWKLFKGVARGAWNLGKALISIPFKIFGGLVAMSQQGGGGVSEWTKAMEELRGTMGDIATGPSKDLIDTTKNMRKQFGSTTGGVRSFRRAFGHGRAGLAAALKFNTELADSMGSSFAQFSGELKKHGSKLAVYRKGLGLSAEAMGKMIKNARAMGTDYMETFKQMGKFALGFAKKYNLSSKQLGKTMGELGSDFSRFGDLAPKELAETATQMHRLGLETKDVQSIMDTFDDFNKGIQAAANLRRQFGMNINASKLMSMTASERMEHLREGLFKTGRKYNDLSRLEKNYMASQIGQTREATDQLMGEGNKRKKLNKVKTDAASIAKRTIKTQKIMLKLAKSIEKQFAGGGGGGYKGFFDALSKGFQKGVMRSQEMRRAMRNLRKSLRVVDMAGRRIGKSFVQNFPGVKQFLGAFADFFDPRNVSRNMLKFTNIFDRFFKALQKTGGTRKALEQLQTDIIRLFKDMFSKRKGAGKEMLLGFDTIATILGNIKIMMLEKSVENAAAFIDGFADVLDSWISGKANKKVGAVGEAVGDAFQERFGDSFSRLSDVVKKKLFPALKKLAPLILPAIQKLMGMVTGFIWDNRTMIFEGIKKMMLFVFKMKWEFLKFAMKDPVLMMVLGFQLFSPVIMGAIGAIFKVGMAKIAGGLAARFMPNFAANLVAGKTLKAAMPNLHRSMSNAVNPMIGPKNKGLWTGMKQGFSSGMKKFSGAGMKGGLKLMGKGLSTGLKAIPVAGWVAGLVIDAGFAFSDAADRYAESGSLAEAGKGFAGSFLSGLTFGMVKADTFEDFIFGSSRAAEKAAAKQAGYAKQHAAQFLSDYGSMFDGAKDKMNDLIAEFSNAGEQTAAALAAGGENLSDSEKTMLQDMIGDQVSLAQIQRDGTAAITKMQKDFSKHNSDLDAVYQAVEEELANDHSFGDIYDDHVTVSEKMLDSATLAMLKSNELVESHANGYVTLDGDQKEFIMGRLEAQKHSARYMEAMVKNQSKDTNFLYQTALMSADKSKMAQTIHLLEKAGTDASAQRQQLDIAIRSAEQVSLLKQFGKYKEGADIQHQYDRLFKEENFGALSKETQVAIRMRQGELERNVMEQTNALLETQADRDTKKLASMEAAAETMRRLKEVEKIPAEIERLQKVMKGVDKDKLDLDISNLMETVGSIADSVTKYTKVYGLNLVKETVSGSVRDNLESIKLMTDTVSGVIKTAGELKSTSNINKKVELISVALTGISDLQLTDLPSELFDTGPLSQLQHTIMPSIVDKDTGILTAVPSNIKTKIAQADASITAISEMVRKLKKGSTLAVAVDIAQGLSKDGKVTMDIDNVTINLNVSVNMNAKNLGEQLLEVQNLNGTSGNRLVTTGEGTG